MRPLDTTDLTTEQLSALIVRLSSELHARLLTERRDVLAPNGDPGLLTVEEAAARLHVTKQFVYRHAAHLKVVKLGAGTLRFKPAEVEAFVSRSRKK